MEKIKNRTPEAEEKAKIAKEIKEAIEAMSDRNVAMLQGVVRGMQLATAEKAG